MELCAIFANATGMDEPFCRDLRSVLIRIKPTAKDAAHGFPKYVVDALIANDTPLFQPIAEHS